MLVITLVLFALNILKWVEPKPSQSSIRGIALVGTGYSSDKQQITPQICYNATVSSISGQQGYVKLDESISYSELEQTLRLSVSVSGSYGMFSADAAANYMRSIQDRDYSISLNYYQYANNKVTVSVAGNGLEALTESGKSFYNDGKNPYFGLICGDYFINSYQQGALLSLGIIIQFGSSKAKKEFEASVGGKFGNIIQATSSIKTAMTEYKITGSIIIQAFQMGGEPNRLANIFNKNSTGEYYALTCSLSAMDNCMKAATGLLDYAKFDFGQRQLSFPNNTGLTQLGIGFIDYDPIEYIGLKTPTSLVTPKVVQYRNELSERLKENENYRQKFYSFLDEQYYPVELNNVFIDKVNSIMSRTKRNVQILLQTHGGAADCFNYPNKCANVKVHIDSQLQKIDTTFLNDLKYTFSMNRVGVLYNTGDGTIKSWAVKPDYKSLVIELWGAYVYSDTEYAYYGRYYDNYDPYHPGGTHTMKFIGHQIQDDIGRYSGTLCIEPEGCKSYTETRQISPFFFETYNTSNSIN